MRRGSLQKYIFFYFKGFVHKISRSMCMFLLVVSVHIMYEELTQQFLCEVNAFSKRKEKFKCEVRMLIPL